MLEPAIWTAGTILALTLMDEDARANQGKRTRTTNNANITRKILVFTLAPLRLDLKHLFLVP